MQTSVKTTTKARMALLTLIKLTSNVNKITPGIKGHYKMIKRTNQPMRRNYLKCICNKNIGSKTH